MTISFADLEEEPVAAKPSPVAGKISFEDLEPAETLPPVESKPGPGKQFWENRPPQDRGFPSRLPRISLDPPEYTGPPRTIDPRNVIKPGDSPEAIRAKALRSGLHTIGPAPEESLGDKAWAHGANVGRGIVSGTGQVVGGVGNWLAELDDFLRIVINPISGAEDIEKNPLPPNALQRAGKAIQEQAVPMYGLPAAEPSVLMQAEESLGAMAPAALTAAASGPAAPWVGATLFAAQGSGGTPESIDGWTPGEIRSYQRVNALLGATEGIPLLRAWGRLTGPVKREIAASALKRYAVRTGRVVGAVGQGGVEEFMQETGSQILGEMWKLKTDNPEMGTVDAAAIATDKVMESDAPKVAFFMGSVFGLLGAGHAAKLEFLDPPVKKWFGENPEKATAVMDRIRAKEALRRADVRGIPGFEKSTADQRAALSDSLEMHELALSNSARMENLTGNRPGVETEMPALSSEGVDFNDGTWERNPDGTLTKVQPLELGQEAVVEPPTAPVEPETQSASPVGQETAPEAVAGVSEQIGAAPGEPETTAPPQPSEPGVSPPLPEPVRLAFETVDRNRSQHGLPPVPKPDSITDVQAWNDMLARNQTDPTWLDSVQKKQTWTREETLGMLYRQMQLEQSRLSSADAVNKLVDSGASPEDIAVAYQRYQDASNAANAFEEANRAVAFEWGGAGRYRQMFLADKDSKPYLESTLRASKGGEALTEADNALIDDVVQKGVKERIAQGKRDEAIVEAEFDDAVKAVEKEAGKEGQKDSVVVKVLEKAAKRLRPMAKEARARILKRAHGNLFSNPLDPEMLSDLSIVAASKIADGVVDIAKFTTEFVSEFGDWVRPHIVDIFAGGRRVLDGELDRATKLASKKTREKVKAAVNKAETPEEKAAAAVEQLKAREDESGPEIGSESRGLIQKLIRAAVESGERGTEPVTNWVIERMKPLFPDITARKIKEIYSEYGKVKTPSNLPVNVEMRRLRRLFQMQLKIADVEKGLKDLQEGKGEASTRDKATGYRRDKADKEERDLAKRLNEMKKKFEKEATALGVKIPTRAGLLESILGRTKRQLRNQIEDLDEQIRTRTKKVGAKTDPVVDQEILDLRKTRDEKRKEFDAIFGKAEMSPEKRIAIAMAAVDRSIAAEEQRMALGRIAPEPKESKTPQTPELQAKRELLASLREKRMSAWKAEQKRLRGELAEIVGNKSRTSEERLARAIEASDKAYERLRTRIETNELQVEKKMSSKPESPDLAKKRARNKEARRTLDEMIREDKRRVRLELEEILGKPAKPEMSPEKRLELAMKAADDTIARLEKAIAEGDVRPHPKETKTPQTPELAAKKARVKELRQIKQDMLDLDNPYQNMLYRKGIEKSIAEMRRREEAGEFAPKPKRHIDLDKESITASADKESAREAFNKAKDRYEYQQMSKWEKLGYYADRAVEASKTLLVNAPLDIASIGRQSRLSMIAELPTFLKAIPDMLKSWKSRKFFEDLRQRIRYSPNHNEYRRAKLNLDFNEFFRSEWIRKIPGFGASGRFFDANMMKLKVDIFDKFLARAEAAYGKGRVPDSELRQYSSDLQTMLGSTTSIKVGRWEGSTKGGFIQKAFLAPAWKMSQLLNSTGFPLIRGLVNLSRGKNPVASRMIVEQYARIYGSMAVFYGILMAAGFTVDDDRMSPTFGGVKRKGGDQWWMPFPSVTQEFGFLNRVVFGQRKTSKGKTIVTRPEPGRPLPFGQMSVEDEIINKIKTMLAPIPSAGFQFFTGQNPVGQPITRTWALAGAYIPITAREIVEAVKRNPRKWLAEALYAFTTQSLGESGRPIEYPKPKK